MADTLSRDPYKTFRFVVEWKDGDNQSFYKVAGINSVSAVTQTTDAIQYRAGDDPLFMKTIPGPTSYAPITLERGLTMDEKFNEWAEKLSVGDQTSEYKDDFRKDIKIQLCDENGANPTAIILKNCWVSSYNPLPDLDSGEGGIAIESLTIENEGWETV